MSDTPFKTLWRAGIPLEVDAMAPRDQVAWFEAQGRWAMVDKFASGFYCNSWQHKGFCCNSCGDDEDYDAAYSTWPLCCCRSDHSTSDFDDDGTFLGVAS